MVAVPPPDPDPVPFAIAHVSRAERASWLVLALDGPATELPALVVGATICVTPDPRRFRDLLLVDRPRIVVVCEPPAGAEELNLTATERRRRSRLRALHLAPPDAAASRMAALARGFDDALTTATTGDELAARLAWLEARSRERPRPGAVLPVAEGMELDLVAHELRRGTASVHLRPKEFALLALMASHPGRAYTREELLQREWGHRPHGGPRTIDVHVRWLRSKIEPDPDHPIHLVTVRGIGYRLDPPDR